MAKQRRTPARVQDLFVDGQPVPLSDLKTKLSAGKPRPDGPSRETASSGGGNRHVKGEGLEQSDLEHVEAIACLAPLWDLAAELQPQYEQQPPCGRKREYHAMDALVFLVATWVFTSYRRTQANLNDPYNWKRIRRAVKRAWPDHPQRRLTPRAISRFQFDRFRKWLLENQKLDEVRHAVRYMCVAGCREIGALDPSSGSFSNPDPKQSVNGDGTWIPGRYRNNNPEAVSPVTGKKRRWDPDAVDYFHNDGTRASSPGHLVVALQCRTPDRQMRVILAVDTKDSHASEPKSDATIAVDLLEELLHDHPELRSGLHCFVYDMALRSIDRDRLLDLGVHPISRIPLTSMGRAPKVPLGLHTFTHPSGSQQQLEVVAADGAPAIVITDGNGDDYLVPLDRKSLKRGKRAVHGIWAIPDIDIVPQDLRNATCRIRHNSLQHERTSDPHRRRTKALSTIPPSDPRFADLYGTREDTESQNSQTKSELRDRRAREVGRDPIILGLIGRQILSLTTALNAHRHLNGADLRRWFGRHKLRTAINRRDGPTNIAA